ncbi:MAG: T9SS type A sorting domain-containing protein [Bacteroidales bacterium]|nr:T9SS type A sorting domain-containing protein [Bacteroidales bacterium]
MSSRLFSLILSFSLSLSTLSAQVAHFDYGFERNADVPVVENGQTLALPWVGGLNSVHFSEVDLNLDGEPDLLGFEKHGNRILPFLRVGGGYQYAPQYARRFPDLHDWAILHDYDHDGRADIFTYGLASIRVFRNISADSLRFELVADPLTAFYYNGYTNIYTSPDDYLVVEDIDSDGHLDILNFWVMGRFVHHLRNYADAGNPFDFRLENECWGHFEEAADNNAVTLFSDCDNKSGDDHTRHTGSSMLLHDFDGNGLPDLLLGDVDSPYNILLYNHGSLSDARMTVQDTAWPLQMPINLYSMPAASFVTLPGRNSPSLVVSPSDPSLTKSQDLNSVWVYDYDTDLQQFTLSQTDFLQREMIDAGSGCHPVLYDFDGDGLTDLFLGNYGQFDSAEVVNGWLESHFSSSVRYYRNTGTASVPVFTLQNRDFGNLKSFGFRALHPTFGDFDGDGLPDMLCGREDGTLVLVSHQRLLTGSGLLTEQYAGVDAGDYSAPQFFDLDGDGKGDLIVGNRRGLLSFFRNTGTSVADFQKITDTLGGVDMRDFTQSYFGYSVPCFYRDAQQGTVLFCGGELGEVSYYKDIDGNLDGLFTKAEVRMPETVNGVALPFKEGRRVAPAVADLASDGRPELVLGNWAGGVAFFTGAEPPVHTSMPVYTPAPAQVRVWPNPAREVVRVEGPDLFQSVAIYDIHGRNVQNIKRVQGNSMEINIANLSPGIYFLKTEYTVTRLVKW